jgi:hypothetical protein
LKELEFVNPNFCGLCIKKILGFCNFILISNWLKKYNDNTKKIQMCKENFFFKYFTVYMKVFPSGMTGSQDAGILNQNFNR